MTDQPTTITEKRARRLFNAEQRAHGGELRACGGCTNVLHTSAFAWDSRAADNLQSRCTRCRVEANRAAAGRVPLLREAGIDNPFGHGPTLAALCSLMAAAPSPADPAERSALLDAFKRLVPLAEAADRA
jgi:hypothetical protein